MTEAALIRTAVLLAAITWLPLALLSVAEGLAIRDSTIPFLKDLSVHVRFLVAVPLLVYAEEPIGRRVRISVLHFLSAKLVRDEDIPRFTLIIERATRFRDSPLVALILAAIVVLTCWRSVASGLGPGVATWYLPQSTGRLSIAGYWYAFVCLPIFLFLILRWILRILVWAFFLWRVARLDLRLTWSHPDEAGGLSFVGRVIQFFGVILFALSAVLSARIATQVLFAGASLYDYLPAYAIFMAIVLAIFAGPQFLFANKLYELKERGLRQYGALASQYTRLFQEKWIDGASGDEPLLGTGDIQSLADLGNSYAVVENMKLVPVGLTDLGMLVGTAVLPALPLAATVMPVKDIAQELLKLIT
ncbi:MAG TPA: hypothetical protein VGH13_26170 [Xanthobacteraceae bacterium]